MEKYVINKDYVLRNIGGIYFAVNIKDKDLYKNKKIYSFNDIGVLLLSILYKNESCDFNELVDLFLTYIIGHVDYDTVKRDIQMFLTEAELEGIIKKYEQ